MIYGAKDAGGAKIIGTLLIWFLEDFSTPEISVSFNTKSLDAMDLLGSFHDCTLAATRATVPTLYEKTQDTASKQLITGLQ